MDAGRRELRQRPAAARRARSSNRRSGTSRSAQRAADKQAGKHRLAAVVPPTRSSGSRASTSGGERGGVRRSATTLIVHAERRPAADADGRREPLSPETAERRAPAIATAPHDQAARAATSCRLACRALRVLRPDARTAQALRPLPVPGCTATRELPSAPHRLRRVRRTDRAREPDPALPPTPQTPARPGTSSTSGTGDAPVFTDAAGRAITDQPATRTTPSVAGLDQRHVQAVGVDGGRRTSTRRCRRRPSAARS